MAPAEEVEEAAPDRAYVGDRLMVRLAPGASPEALGLVAVREAGPSGWTEVAVDDPVAAARALHGDERVVGIQPVGRTRGAVAPTLMAAETMLVKVSVEESFKSSALQYHHTATKTAFRATNKETYRGLVVAVLDTGVADWVEGMSEVPIVAPYDFVNDDADATDDNQHGTHIASLIAAQGTYPGIAPSVSIMPVKVLDADNVGTESDLVDGIHWAIDHGADVINMSLSFGLDYVPSPALVDALQRASDEGVVLVAAAGNDGADQITWPAAHPHVIAVSSTCFDLQPAPYANAHPSVTVSAPGGCLDRDSNGDGYIDGLLADTIDPDDPNLGGYWFMAGTSQAAALVSGAAARVLYTQGGSPRSVARALQRSSMVLRDRGIEDGFGRGSLLVAGAERMRDDGADADQYYVSLLPWLSEDGVPSARIAVLDADGVPATGVTVHASFRGSTTTLTSCLDLVDGLCDIAGDAADASDDTAHWTVSVDAVVRDGLSWPIEPVIYSTDSLDTLLAAMDADPELEGLPLAIAWEAQDHAELGPMGESVVAVNGGTGFASLPLGVILSPRAMSALTESMQGHDVDLDGTGFASLPLGMVRVYSRRLGGTGFASLPLGFRRLVTMGGTGFASLPLGLGAGDIYLPGGRPVSLPRARGVSVDISGTPLHARLEDGGFGFDGYDTADVLGSSFGPEQDTAVEVTAVGAVELD